jgi:hypothetical protein
VVVTRHVERWESLDHVSRVADYDRDGDGDRRLGWFRGGHGNGPDSGSASTNLGPTTSSQTITWNLGARQASAWATNSDGVSTSYGIDAITDWITADDHYDSRTARNCDATGSSTRGGTRNEPSDWGTRDVNGLQKAAGCFYLQNTTPSYSNCQYIQASIDGCTFGAAKIWTHKSHEVWLRREDGTVDHNDGGFVQLPND